MRNPAPRSVGIGAILVTGGLPLALRAADWLMKGDSAVSLARNSPEYLQWLLHPISGLVLIAGGILWLAYISRVPEPRTRLLGPQGQELPRARRSVVRIAVASLVLSVIGAIPLWFLLPPALPLRAIKNVGVSEMSWREGKVEKRGSCHAVIDGQKLMRFRAQYKFAFACGLVDPDVDRNEDRRIGLSRAFTIRPENMHVAAPASDGFIEKFTFIIKSVETLQGKKATPEDPMNIKLGIPLWTELFLLPLTVSIDDITKLSDVTVRGGILIDQQVTQ